MLYVILGILVVAAAAALYFLRGASSPKPSKPTQGTTIEDEEGTQVKVVGHRLVRLQGGVKVGNEFPVVGSVTIGSGPACTMTLTDPAVAAIHANVRIEGGRAVVEDAGTSSGTLVNDERLSALTPKTLKDGDVIKVGTSTVLYRSAG